MLPIVIINPGAECKEGGEFTRVCIEERLVTDDGESRAGLLSFCIVKEIHRLVSFFSQKRVTAPGELTSSEYVFEKEWDFDELCKRYQSVRLKMLFLPLKRGIDLKKFVEDYGDDVHYCSEIFLDIYCVPSKMEENAFKTIILPLGMNNSAELPALALWEWDIKKSVYLSLFGLSEEEIYQVIEHLCNTVKEEPDISLASLSSEAERYREKLEEKKRPVLIQKKVVQNEVRIVSNSGFVNVVTGDHNHIEQSSSALGFPPEQWQRFIDVLRENGMHQRKQGERVMELLGQIKLAAEAKDEKAVQEKAGQVRELLKSTGSDMILQGLHLAGSLASIVSMLV